MANNIENLRVPTSEEARENGRKGGKASAKARRERKLMCQTLAELLAMTLKDGEHINLEEIQSIASLKGKNITVQEAIMLAQIQKAIKGNTRAAEFVRDASGNMLNAESQAKIEKLKAEIEKLKAETERIKGGDDSTEDKVAKLFEALGEVLDVK